MPPVRSTARPRWRAGVAVAGVLFVLVTMLAGCIPPGFVEDVVFSGLDQPMAVRFSPDGRVFVAEKRGVVKVFDGLNDPTPTTVLDLRTKVYNQLDRGLMSIALDPDFPTDPKLYVLYSYDAAIGGTAPRWGTPGQDADPCPDPPGQTFDGCVSSARLSRFTLTGNVAGPETVLINDWCAQYPSHSVGDLKFGPDGYLYASGGDAASYDFADYGQAGNPRNPCGDPPGGVGGVQTVPTAEGGALRAQDYLTPGDPQTLDGSIIRVDPDTGQGAPNNPLSASTDANARRIVAQGVRNSFRMAFRPGTTELWFGDVGWDTWEEIDRLANPLSGTVANFGWPCIEGPEATGYDIGLNLCNGLYDGSVPTVDPVFTYRHLESTVDGDNCSTNSGSSISGVAFYPGGPYPDEYDGALFFADYSRRCIWVMERGVNGAPDPATRRVFHTPDAFPVDLEIGPNGDLYYVDIALGEVHRFRFSSGPQPPVAAISANKLTGPLPLTVSLSAAGSSDPDGGALTYAWDLDDDGQFDDATGVTTSVTYTTAGVRTPRVLVTDPDGEQDTASVQILAGTTPPVPTITAPLSTLRWAVGDAIPFSGSATDAEDGALPASALRWDVIMHHCVTVDGCHEHGITSIVGQSSGTIFAPDHDYPSFLELRLTATDSAGAKASTSVRLDPRSAPINVQTVPSGVPVTLGGSQSPSPVSTFAIVNSRLSLSVPATYQVGASQFTFTGWSDGQPRAHDFFVPAAGITLTATYTQTSGPDVAEVAAYNFDAGSGGTLADGSGHGHPGTISGPAWVAGHSGGGLRFDGVNDVVNIADHADFDFTTALTIEGWVFPTGGTDFQTLAFKDRPGGGVYGLYAVDGGTTTPGAFLHIGGNDQGFAGPNPLPRNVWSHVAMTYDGTMQRIFVNGVQVASQPMTGPTLTSADPVHLGGNPFYGEYFAGSMDDVRFYSRPLSAAEIALDRDTPVP